MDNLSDNLPNEITVSHDPRYIPANLDQAPEPDYWTEDGYPVIRGYKIDDVKYRILKNGTVFDIERPRFLTQSPRDVITAERSHEMHVAKAARRLEAQAAAQSGMAKGLKTDTGLEAWERIAGVRAQQALDKSRDGNDATLLLGRMTGFIEQRGEEGTGNKDLIGLGVFATPEAMAKALLLVREKLGE